MRICPSYLSFILYNPIRKAFTDRNRILEESGIAESSVVLEVGAGNGFITEAIAEKARKVYAVELQQGMVKKLKKRMVKFGGKVVIIECDIAAIPLCPPLPNGGDGAFDEQFADVAIMYYSFHEVAKKAEASKNIGRAVKPGGILAIYEPTVEVNKAGMQKTVGMFESMGFQKEIERDGRFTRFARLRKAATGSK